jgi:16S rRNA (guanine527-N7)-methyltransferase
MSTRALLQWGLETLRIASTPEQLDRSLRFIALIDKWNRVDNLTAITDPAQMVIHHLLDSLSIHSQLLDAARVLDVGSGAGLPGIPLAIFSPTRAFTLLDAAAKRVRFMRHAVTTLGLDNVEVVQGRAEAFQSEGQYDVIISRAFASTADFVLQTAAALAPGGRILAMKGKLPEQELSALPANFEYTVMPLQVPGLAAERHLITITAVP